MKILCCQMIVLCLGLLGLGAPAIYAQTSVSLSVIDSQGAETWPGQTPNPASIRVSRTGSIAAALRVWLKVSGTSLRGVDYSTDIPVAGSITIPAGRAHSDLFFNIIDDRLAESAEIIRIDLEDEDSANNPVPYAIGNDRVQLTIQDNDSLAAPATVTVVEHLSAAEGQNAQVVDGAFRLLRSGDLSAGLSVSYSIQGNALPGQDYVGLSGNVLIPAGSTFVDVVVKPLEDSELEGDESIILTLLPSACPEAFPPSAACYAFGDVISASLRILDNEVPPVRAVVRVEASGNASESAQAGPGSAFFRLVRSVNIEVPLHVSYTLSGSATHGIDYESLPGSLLIPAGVESMDVRLKAIDDVVLEGAESVVMTLLASACPEPFPAADCYQLGLDATASVGILDDEIAPVAIVTASQSTNVFGLPAAGLGSFTSFSTKGHIVSYQVRVDNAVRLSGDTGYTVPPAPGTPFDLSFPIPNLGAGRHTVQAIVTDNLGNSGTGSFLLLITNIPPPPTTIEIVAIDAEASETLPGEPLDTALFRFTLTGGLDLGIWDFGFVGTAQQPWDYTLIHRSGSLTTNGNLVTWTTDVEVVPVDDLLVEGSETVNMQMCFVIIAWVYGVGAPIGTECTGGTPGLNATITIRDNDTSSPHPLLKLTATDGDAQEISSLSGDPPNPGTFEIRRTGSPTNDLPVHYTWTGSAMAGVDYVAIPGTTVIPAGAASVTLEVTPLFDHFVEGFETVTLTLRSGESEPRYLLDPGLRNQATVTIRDYAPSHLPVIRVKVTDSMAFEQASTSPHASFRIERSGSLATEFTAPYLVGGTAVNGRDYVRLSGSASMPLGINHAVLTVIPYIDTELQEPDETVVITLAVPPLDLFPPTYLVGGAGLSAASAGATIREDAPVVRPRPMDRFERARRLRFPGRYRVIPLPVLDLPVLPGSAPIVWAVEASTDFVTWQGIGETQDPEEFLDVDTGDAAHRFYRFREVPPETP